MLRFWTFLDQMGKSGKTRSNLTVSSIKINQPVKQQKLTFGNSTLSQGAEPLFESDTCSSNEAKTVSQHDFKQGGPAKRTRLKPTKRRNESDSEIEINESIKQSLLKKEQRWIFVSKTELYAIICGPIILTTYSILALKKTRQLTSQ